MRGMKTGKIIPNGVSLQKHEYDTVLVLTELGYDVELIPKSNKLGEKSPDIRIGKVFWEIKSPKGEGKWLIKKTMQRASHQAENIIIDLRRIKIHQNKCLAEFEKHFKLSRRIKRLKIITKTRKIVDFVK